jgi:hypothetical protein
MKKSAFRRSRFLLAVSLLLVAPLPQAALFPDGLLGMRLGQSRVEALTALVAAGAVPDMEKAQCSDKVPEKNRTVANRICKLTLQPGSAYQGLPVNKVTLLLQEESLVLIGVYVAGAPSSGPVAQKMLHQAFESRFGVSGGDSGQGPLRWAESAEGAEQGTHLQLWNDDPNAFVVYAFEGVR